MPRRKPDETRSYFDMRCGAVPDFDNPKQYIADKLEILRHQMHIQPTIREILHLESLKTMGDIDRAVHTIIENHWN